MQPTDEQRQAIRNHDRNLIVVAGAGSGKTRVLVERYIQLLNDNPDWTIQSLVAITFTRAAAHEMRQRLRSEVDKRAKSQPEGVWSGRLAQLDSARIDTIHGLCADILRANAAAAGIDPLFTVLEETEAALLLSDIVEDALAEVPPPQAQLFAQVDAWRIAAVLNDSQLLNAELPPMPPDAETLLAKWRAQVDESLLQARDELLRTDEVAALRRLSHIPARDKLGKLALQYREAMSVIDGADEAEHVRPWLEDLLDAGAIGNKGRTADWGGKEAKSHAANLLRSLLNQVREICQDFGELSEIDRATAEALLLWDGLLRGTRRRYQDRKRQSALLDFDDLEQLAADLLTDPAIRARYRQAEFKHLLVDEFQDTNAAQWRIIQALADLQRGGSLFLVGDPKQSIYQFRGADVSVFNRVRGQIAGHSAGLELPLNMSFRAHDRLVAQYNLLFNRILRRNADSPVRDFEVLFDGPMRAFRQESPREAAIELLLLDKHIRDADGEVLRSSRKRKLEYAADELRSWEAFELARRIQEIVADKRQVYDRESNRWRPIRYGDIAILFRALTSVTIYEEAFKAQGLAFLTLAGRGYYDRQEVWDMLDLLRCLHNPRDDLSLAAVLRSPMFAFRDDLLLALRLMTDEAGEMLMLWEALQRADESLPGIDAPDLPRLRHARQTLRSLRAMAGRVSISELLRQALDATNYLAILTGLPDGGRRRGNVEKLLQLADDSGRISLGKFARYLDDLTAREAREGEAPLQAENALRLMSVHASKGLEFPMVILADASRQRRHSGGLLLADVADGLNCQVYDAESGKYASGYAHKQSVKLLNSKEEAEAKRLLYVAATRAQDYLLVSGAIWQNQAGDWQSDGFMQLLLDGLELGDLFPAASQSMDFAGHPLRIAMPASPPAPGRLHAPAQSATSLWDFEPDPRDYPPQMPPLLQPLLDFDAPAQHISVTQLAELGGFRYLPDRRERQEAARRFQQDEPRDDDPAPNQPARSQRLLGDIVHELLRYAEQRHPQSASDDMIDAVAWARGVTDGRRLAALRRDTRALLNRYAGSDVKRWVEQAQAAQRPVYRELSFMYPWHGRVLHGVMDLLLQMADGSWRIIDFKTGEVRGELPSHAQQYRLQLGVYAAAVQQKLALAESPRLFIHYMRHKQTVELAAADCQADLQRLDITLDEAAGGYG